MSAADYKVQINVKVGDHLINVNGADANEAIANLTELAERAAEVHGFIEILDGRTATEIVQKEKTWGARSQGGRTYPSRATAPSATGSATSSPQQPAATADPSQLLQNELGAVVVAPETHVAASPAAPPEVLRCGIHGSDRQYFGPGVSSKTGKEYGASYRCPERGCSAIWQRTGGRWG